MKLSYRPGAPGLLTSFGHSGVTNMAAHAFTHRFSMLRAAGAYIVLSGCADAYATPMQSRVVSAAFSAETALHGSCVSEPDAPTPEEPL